MHEPANQSANQRRAQILRFLFRYRNSGLFSGVDAAPEESAHAVPEGTPEELAQDLEALGPAFVKIGQMLSTRPDIVPPAFATSFERMQENVEPVPCDDIREVVEAELGVRLSHAFSEFEDTPLGTASLAQVHRARLRDGTPVAVKVQKPGIAKQLMGDLELLRGLAQKADRYTDMGRRVRFADWLEEFSRTLINELDYQAEAENLERFREHLAPFPQLWVPAPVWDLTRRRVLTMELAEGIRVDQIPGVRRTEEPMDDLADALLRGYLDQIFVHGEIHADPHPGNLRITREGRLAIFDLGMVTNVPPKRRDCLLKLLFAAVDGRGEQVANEAIAMGTRLEDYDEERFVREVGHLVSHYHAHAQTTSPGRVVLELVRIATGSGLRTPPELSLLGKTLLNLDAVSRCLAPTLDIKQVVERHLQHVMRARLRQSLSSPNLASELIEIQTLLREGPRKLSDALSLVAENKLQMRVTGLEESRLMENLQKIANRISAGLVTAALIVASSLMMRVETASTLWGYPTVALLLFLVGAGLGVCIVVSALRGDRAARSREERAPR
jgi:predicted unusual protein kinase regulating ubiquinone biosynthesis (AarF/ABC1/UbiB family)